METDYKKEKKTFFFGMLKNNHRLKTRFNKKKRSSVPWKMSKECEN